MNEPEPNENNAPSAVPPSFGDTSLGFGLGCAAIILALAAALALIVSAFR
jgi:hypothetical protein